MDSYRVEKQAAMRLQLPDQEAEIEPVPAVGGGRLRGRGSRPGRAGLPDRRSGRRQRRYRIPQRPDRDPGRGGGVGRHRGRAAAAAETGTRTVVQNGPQGTRTIVQVVGGRFEGPRVKASVETPAGDWITNRADGSYRLDVRLTLKTDDGALILVTYNGIGQTTDAGASLRIAPLFETGDSRYVWLTRLQAVGVGDRVGTTVTYDIYALK